MFALLLLGLAQSEETPWPDESDLVQLFKGATQLLRSAAAFEVDGRPHLGHGLAPQPNSEKEL